jgi:hypothetical protein
MWRLVLPLVCLLGGCASPRAVLVNDQGQYTTCAATSVGMLGSMVAQSRYESCVSEATEKGYRIESQQ